MMDGKILFGLALLTASVVTACEKGPVSVVQNELGDVQPEPEEVVVDGIDDARDLCEADPRVQLGLVSKEVCVGANLFFRDKFDGNGRSCATCHSVTNNFTIDKPFMDSLPASDPLFIAETDPNLATLERPELLREFGLIVENVDGVEDLNNKFTLRSVPHTLSMATSIAPAFNDGTTLPPNQRTGWSGDGAPGNGELRDFQTGAIFQHYPRDLSRTPGVSFRLPTDEELDAIEAFQLTLGRTNEISLGSLTLTDSEAQAGVGVFLNQGACNGCHLNAGANAAFGGGGNRNFDTGVERIRIALLDDLGMPRDGGFGGQGLVDPNFDSDGDGVNDAFGNGGFNTPPLIEAADTGPFFHTNAFETIEDAVAFYNTDAFNNSPSGRGLQFARGGPVAMSDVEVKQVGRLLRVINVAFNLQMAVQRLNAVTAINQSPKADKTLEQTLIQLASAETEDAFKVLTTAPGATLHAHAHEKLELAIWVLSRADASFDPVEREFLATTSRDIIQAVNDELGTGLSFTLGEGNLMF